MPYKSEGRQRGGRREEKKKKVADDREGKGK
jgi:hypothetical protein